MRLGFQAVLHGIQQIGFNPFSAPTDEDYGLLYVAVGDGEAPGMHTSSPQSLQTPRGKILRINTMGTDSPNGGYGIPNVNPFVGQRDALGEIWALGLRNPHRFSWDSTTGEMLISHIGEARVDAIFPGVEAANYGWNEQEGGFRYEKADPLEVYPVITERPEFMSPVIRLDHDDMSALVGGFVYRGGTLEALSGTYLFADLATGTVFEASASELAPGQADPPIRRVQILDSQGSETTMAILAGRSRAEIRFGEDANGNIYILSKANGAIWRIAEASGVGVDMINSAPRLSEGIWSGRLAPMNHLDQISPLMFSVAYEDDLLAMVLSGPDEMEIPIRNARVDGDTLRFEFNEPEGNFLLTCALAGEANSGFEGRCADESGKWAFVGLEPPTD